MTKCRGWDEGIVVAGSYNGITKSRCRRQSVLKLYVVLCEWRGGRVPEWAYKSKDWGGKQTVIRYLSFHFSARDSLKDYKQEWHPLIQVTSTER